ncbi:unnamed protein product [Cuscuta europaea]|uniref:Uncharacterized protein n=1 Tax=Cuscuta europaea TaxID=41803 RepID=A0A9P0YPJ1_CUSEU|nr:unnamed protein product [Cuscuta europaea]
MHDTVEPKGFLKGITSEMDRAALGTYDDDALQNKILRASLTACIALGEQARRFDEWRLQKAQQDESLKKLIHDNADAVRQMMNLEEELRQAKAEAERARAEGKAKAEKAAAEAAQKALEEAEAVKAEAVAKAREDAIAVFLLEGWKAEGHKDWVASVLEASADEWVKGPGAMWLAWKGEDYYAGGSSSLRPSSTGGSPGTSGWTKRTLILRPMVFPPST